MDISGSSAFGSIRRSKRESAVEIAATLACSAARSSDKVGLLLFTDQVELFLPPRKGRSHILRTIKEMLFFQPKNTGTNIPAALAFLNHVIKRRSIVFLFTDFLRNSGDEPRSSQAGRDMLQEIGMTNARHDLVCVHLHDPRESSLPNAGLLTIEDAETGELLELDSTRADRPADLRGHQHGTAGGTGPRLRQRWRGHPALQHRANRSPKRCKSFLRPGAEGDADETKRRVAPVPGCARIRNAPGFNGNPPVCLLSFGNASGPANPFAEITSTA